MKQLTERATMNYEEIKSIISERISVYTTWERVNADIGAMIEDQAMTSSMKRASLRGLKTHRRHIEDNQFPAIWARFKAIGVSR